MDMESECFVFWDLDNCPVSSSVSGHEVVASIRKLVETSNSRRIIGFNAYLDVAANIATAESTTFLRDLHLSSATIIHCPLVDGGEKSTAAKISADVTNYFAARVVSIETTALIISSDPILTPVVSWLALRGFKVLNVRPCNNPSTCVSAHAMAIYCWDCDVLKKPLGNTRCSFERPESVQTDTLSPNGSNGNTTVECAKSNDSTGNDTDWSKHEEPESTSPISSGTGIPEATTCPYTAETTPKMRLPLDIPFDPDEEEGTGGWTCLAKGQEQYMSKISAQTCSDFSYNYNGTSDDEPSAPFAGTSSRGAASSGDCMQAFPGLTPSLHPYHAAAVNVGGHPTGYADSSSISGATSVQRFNDTAFNNPHFTRVGTGGNSTITRTAYGTNELQVNVSSTASVAAPWELEQATNDCITASIIDSQSTSILSDPSQEFNYRMFRPLIVAIQQLSSASGVYSFPSVKIDSNLDNSSYAYAGFKSLAPYLNQAWRAGVIELTSRQSNGAAVVTLRGEYRLNWRPEYRPSVADSNPHLTAEQVSTKYHQFKLLIDVLRAELDAGHELVERVYLTSKLRGIDPTLFKHSGFGKASQYIKHAANSGIVKLHPLGGKRGRVVELNGRFHPLV